MNVTDKLHSLMSPISYIREFLAADTKDLRERASKEARDWCIQRNPHWTDQYQLEYHRYVRSYLLNYCHETAKARI